MPSPVFGFADLHCHTYADWPKFTTMVHQQLFVDWLKRALSASEALS